MTVAIRVIGATRTAILGALEPATAVCFGVLLFGEQLTLRLVIGIIVILTAVTIVVTGKRISTRFPRFCKKHYLALIRKTR